MNDMPKNRIIGFAYIQWHGEYFAADLYEGNIVHYPDGNVDSIPDHIYQKNLRQYQEQVGRGEKIATAYEANLKMGKEFYFKIPSATADPEAAEKEWYQRTHPEIFLEPASDPEPPVKRRSFLGRKKREPSLPKGKITCPSCGAANETGKKFCGDCGASLMESPDFARKSEPGQDVLPESVHPVEEGHAERSLEPEGKGTEPEGQWQEKAKAPAGKTVVQGESSVEPDRIYEKMGSHKSSRKEVAPSNLGREEGTIGRAGNAKRKGRFLLLFIFMAVLSIFLAAFAAFSLYLYRQEEGDIQNTPDTAEAAAQEEPFVAVMFTRDMQVDEMIEQSDLEGCILNEDQYEKYTNISTYINAEGETVVPILIPWEDMDSIIGKRVTSDVKKGALVYDTTITSQHVVADRTYVDATINGQDGTYEIEGDVLPGNTKIQIVAVVSTDGADPVQVLLSEMTLQDRSLQSIFDSAGQDVLEILAGEDESEPLEEGASEETSDIEAVDGQMEENEPVEAGELEDEGEE